MLNDVELPRLPRDKLKVVSKPPLDDNNINDEDITAPRELPTIAADGLMNNLHVVRMCIYHWLYPVVVLARDITRWTGACDKRLFRLMCYINSVMSFNLVKHVGDHLLKCKVLLFTDSDIARHPCTSKSTTGLFMALVGPHTFAPFAATSNGHTTVSHNSTEEDIIDMEYARRVRGTTIFVCWGVVLPLSTHRRRDSKEGAGVDSNTVANRTHKCPQKRATMTTATDTTTS